MLFSREARVGSTSSLSRRLTKLSSASPGTCQSITQSARLYTLPEERESVKEAQSGRVEEEDREKSERTPVEMRVLLEVCAEGVDNQLWSLVISDGREERRTFAVPLLLVDESRVLRPTGRETKEESSDQPRSDGPTPLVESLLVRELDELDEFVLVLEDLMKSKQTRSA